MSGPITEPGWYRLGPKGLERLCGLEELPDDIEDVPPLWELARVEVAPAAAVEEPLW